MTRIGRREVLKLAGAGLAAGMAIPRAGAAQAAPAFGSWPQPSYDAANTGYNPDAVGPRRGIERAWEFTTDADAAGHWAPHTEPLVADDFVILPSLDGNYYALDAGTGAELARIEAGTTAITRPAIGDGAVFISTGETLIRAIDVESGADRWTYEHGMGAGPYRFTYHEGRLYLPGVVALDTRDGSEAWVAEVGAGWFGVAVADGTVFAATEAENRVYAHDAQTGAERWLATVDGRIEEHVAPVAADGHVVVQTESSVLHALDVDTGEPRWRFDPGPSTRNASTPAAAAGTLYYGHSAPYEPDTPSPTDGALIAIDLATGAERWRVDTPGGIEASPVVADGVVYVGTYGDVDANDSPPWLIAVDASTGAVLWDHEMAASVVANPIAGERLYVMVGDGVLEVFGPAESTTPADPDASADRVEVFTAAPDGSAPSRERGFLSNDADEPDFLTNAFNLTVLGFLLSVLGLLYQMLEGR